MKNSSTKIAENVQNFAKSSASETSEIMRDFGDSEISVENLFQSHWIGLYCQYQLVNKYTSFI